MNLRPTRAEINTDALRHNLALLRGTVGPHVEVVAVVKANCYGHDASICVPALRSSGVASFAVATIEEAEALRGLGVTERIMVLAPPLRGQYDAFVALDVEPFISSGRSAGEIAALARANGRLLRAHLFVDTGMGRDGVRWTDAMSLLDALAGVDGLRLTGIASHFATSDEPECDWGTTQQSRFTEIIGEATRAGYTFDMVHMANSGGILNYPLSHFTAVRPGISLYGYHPTKDLQDRSGLRPVLSLRTVIANMTRYPAGSPVSYGRRWWTSCDTWIATLPIGYADGLMRLFTNRLDVIVGGKRKPVVGTICMDEVIVDLGADTEAGEGDEVLVVGASENTVINAWDLADRVGTIPYEICTNLSSRVPRVAIPHDSDASGIAPATPEV